MSKPLVLMLILSMSWITGCATKVSMLGMPLDEGDEQTFSFNYETVSKATYEAVVLSGLSIEDRSEPTNGRMIILAKKSSSAWSWGEFVRIVVQETEKEKETLVRVLTKRRLAINVTAKGNWSDTLFSHIAMQLRYKNET